MPSEKQFYPVTAPIGGLQYAIPANLIEDNQMPGCANVRFQKGIVLQRQGYGKFDVAESAPAFPTLPLSDSVVGLSTFDQFDGTNWFLAMSIDDIYRFNATTGWTSILGAVTFTGSDDNFFWFDDILKSGQTDVWWIGTNGVDDIVYWTGSGNIDYLNNFGTGEPTHKAKYLAAFKDYIVTGHTIEAGNNYPQRVKWSDRSDPTTWTTGNSGDYDIPGSDPIKGMVAFRGNYLCIFKRNSVWLMQETFQNDIFEFREIETDIGCPAGKTITAIDDVILFLGNDNVYAFNGVNATKIGDPIRYELFDFLDPDNVERCFSVDYKDKQEWLLFVVTTSSPDGYPDALFVYNYFYNAWTRGALEDYMTAGGLYTNQSNITIGELVDNIEDQGWRFGDRDLQSLAPIVTLGDKDGNIYQYSSIYINDDGTAIDSEFESKDFMFSQLASRVVITRMDVYYIGNSLKVYYSVDRGSTWSLITTLGASTNYAPEARVWFRVNSDMIRFRFENDTAGESLNVREYRIYWQIEGRQAEDAV